MNFFPVSSSVLCASSLSHYLKDQYGWSIRPDCSLLKTFVNDTYLVTYGKEQYVLRIYTRNWRSETEVQAELDLLLSFKKSGISVAYPIADKLGAYKNEIPAPEGKRWAVLFSYAKGEKKLQALPEQHFSIGQMMAQLHRFTINKRINRVDYTPRLLLHDSFTHYRQYLDPLSADRQYMEELLQETDGILSNADRQQIRKGVVHLDIWADNLHIDEARQATIFDFDFCGNGWLCMDIAFYLMMLFSMEPDEKIFAEKRQAFINGYNSVETITDEELRLLPALGNSLHIFYLGVQQQRFGTLFFNKEHLIRYIQIRIKKWNSYNQQR